MIKAILAILAVCIAYVIFATTYLARDPDQGIVVDLPRVALLIVEDCIEDARWGYSRGGWWVGFKRPHPEKLADCLLRNGFTYTGD